MSALSAFGVVALVAAFPVLYRLATAGWIAASMALRRPPPADPAKTAARFFAGSLGVAAALVAAALVATGTSPRELLLGTASGEATAIHALAGVAAGALLVPLGLGARAAWVRIEGSDGGEPGFLGTRAATGLAGQGVVLLASLVVLEEVLWRAGLGRSLAELGAPAPVVALLTSASYASLHVHWGARETVVHGLNGVAYYALFHFTGGSLVAPALAHAVLNAWTYRRLRIQDAGGIKYRGAHP